MAGVLIIGQDWTLRALLRAQLLEEGIEVKAYETVASALEDQAGQHSSPRLILADISASDHPKAELEQLQKWEASGPKWILSSHTAAKETDFQGLGLERVLFRPVQLGELASAIKKWLEEHPGN